MSMEIPAELVPLRDFHGHLGPFVVAGWRAGWYAVEQLQGRRHFGMHVVLRCPPRPPPSCLADGLQFSTGCTFGKRNIELTPSDDISIEFTNTDTGRALVLRLPPETAAAFPGWVEEMGEEAAAVRVWGMGVDLFQLGPMPR